MPVAAVVDGRIFCTHGGIPEERKYEKIGLKKAINKIPCPLPDPENQSPLAWDLMWADPARESDMNEETNNTLFLDNFRRKEKLSKFNMKESYFIESAITRLTCGNHPTYLSKPVDKIMLSSEGNSIQMIMRR